MTRDFTNGHPQRLQACNFLSQYYFYNIFLQKSCRFSFQILAKCEAAKTGSGVGFLRFTAVCVCGIPYNYGLFRYVLQDRVLRVWFLRFSVSSQLKGSFISASLGYCDLILTALFQKTCDLCS